MLQLPTNRGVEFIDFATIIRIEAKSNYSKLYFNNGKSLVVAKVLRWFENNLPEDQFIRVHRTHQINKNYIFFSKSSATRIELITGECIDVARRKKSYLMKHCCGLL